jgi:hypothetical protein
MHPKCVYLGLKAGKSFSPLRITKTDFVVSPTIRPSLRVTWNSTGFGTPTWNPLTDPRLTRAPRFYVKTGEAAKIDVDGSITVATRAPIPAMMYPKSDLRVTFSSLATE